MSEERLQLADAWWELAESRKAEDRDAMLLHAGDWYRQALDNSHAGLIKLKIEKRLEELVEVRERRGVVLSRRTLAFSGNTPGNLWSDATP